MYEKLKHSEFEVQSFAFANLRRFFKVRGEVRLKELYPPLQTAERADIVVFSEDGTKPMLIIECKRSKRCKDEKQGIRYKQATGLPVIYCRGMQDAFNIVKVTSELLAGLQQRARCL